MRDGGVGDLGQGGGDGGGGRGWGQEVILRLAGEQTSN